MGYLNLLLTPFPSPPQNPSYGVPRRCKWSGTELTNFTCCRLAWKFWLVMIFVRLPTFYLDNLIRPTNELDPTDLKSGRVKVGSAPTVPMGISAYERCSMIISVNVRTRACLDVIYTLYITWLSVTVPCANLHAASILNSVLLL